MKTFGLWKGEWHGNLNTLSPTDGAYYDVMENSEDFQREIQSLAPTVTKENEKFLTMFHRNILYADKLVNDLVFADEIFLDVGSSFS